ncbi:MAG TPA: hypothetical protein VGH28_23045 [Polyangiaceae bacterium]|jgi:hypothetical protein
MRLFAIASALLLIGIGAGCGSSSPDTSDSGTVDTDAATPTEAGDEATPAADAGPVTFPASHTSMPLVDYNGGRILANPKIVTVTFAGDDPTLVSRLQQFDDIITTTPWWTAVSSEYCQQGGTAPCIGQGSGYGHVVIGDAPDANYTDSSQGGPSTIQAFLKQHTAAGADGGPPDIPSPDDNTLYVLYFPSNVTITLDGDASCDSFGAYHNTATLPNANGVLVYAPYAIIPRCGTKESTTTVSASHEIIEASTDPDIGENVLSYYMLNQLWAIAGGEVGDLCEGIGSSGTTTTESTFVVQRSWSNKSAAAGNDPCVPIPTSEIYFNAAPRQKNVVLSKAGVSAVVDIDAFSDAPRDPWALSAVDFAGFQQGNSLLSFSFDKTNVQNGDHVQLTVTALSAIPGSDEFLIESKDSTGTRHSWPVQVTSK